MSVGTLLKKERDGTLFKQTAETLGATHLQKTLQGDDEEKSKVSYELEGKTNFQGLGVDIENAKGSVRKGTNADGTKWETKFRTPYGYIRGTEGADGEPVDCYVGGAKDAPNAYVVRQRKDDGSYDEDTVMLGYNSKADAKSDILRHYDDPKYVGSVISIAMDRLHELVDSKKKLTKISSSIHPDQGGLHYIDADEPGMTGLPARWRRRRGEVPSREEVELNPTPKVENRQDSQNNVTIGPLAAVEGTTDVGKYAKVETLGELDRSWEPPSRDEEASPKASTFRNHIGGLGQAAAAQTTAEEVEGRGPFKQTLSEISGEMGQDEEGSKRAQARFPKQNRVGDNRLDIQTMGDAIQTVPGGAAPADGYAKAAEELIAKHAQVFVDSFLKELQHIADANGGIPPWRGELQEFGKFASQQLYKEALTMAMPQMAMPSMGQGLRQMGQGISRAVGKLRPATVSPEVAAFRKGPGILKRFSNDLATGGKLLGHDAQAAGRAAGLGSKDLGALQQMRPTSAGRRIAGETAQATGHHMGHANAGLFALNPVGVPMGGAIEGFTRGVGKELQRAGSTRAQAAGRLMERHAPKVGFGGELVAGGLLHTPGLAAHLGASAAPTAHAGVQHLLGAGAQEAYTAAPKVLPRMARAVRGAVGFAGA